MKRLVLITILVVVLIGIFWFVFSLNDNTSDEALTQASSNTVGQDNSGRIEEVESVPGMRQYIHNYLGFNFLYPERFRVGGFYEGESGEVILVQSQEGEVNEGFQIYITPLPEDVTLSPSLIMSELPGTLVDDPKQITLDGAVGIMFESNGEGFDGKSYEIWFTKAGNLYQVSSHIDFKTNLQDIIGSWHF